MKALQRFHDQFPEYEARLALWKTPEERARSFLVDELWATYHDLPNITKWELKEQLGPLYTEAFVNKDTRNYEAIPIETMQFWLSAMQGDPVGTFQYDGTNMQTPLEMTDIATARQVQVFYDIRDRMFQYQDVIKPLQDRYFDLEEGAARREYRRLHPALEQYWNWRREFMLRNPAIINYIEDDPEKQPKYQTVSAMEQAFAQEQAIGGKTRDEWRSTLGFSAWNLVEQNIRMGIPLEPVVVEYIELATGQDAQIVLGQITNILAAQ